MLLTYFHERRYMRNMLSFRSSQKIANAIAQPPLPVLTLATNLTDSKTP